MQASIRGIVMNERVINILRVVLLLLLVNMLLANLLVVFLPGDVVQIGAQDQGGFFLATVAIGPANLWRALYAMLESEASLTWSYSSFPNGLYEFEESQKNAYMVVKSYLGYKEQFETLFVPQGIKGSSGGLMFALACYQQLTGLDLCRGLRISGSGTLTGEGLVEQVQGTKQKVLAAKKHQMDIFFVHPDNFYQARSANTEIMIVPVNSFEEALSFLLDTNKQSLYNL